MRPAAASSSFRWRALAVLALLLAAAILLPAVEAGRHKHHKRHHSDRHGEHADSSSSSSSPATPPHGLLGSHHHQRHGRYPTWGVVAIVGLVLSLVVSFGLTLMYAGVFRCRRCTPSVGAAVVPGQLASVSASRSRSRRRWLILASLLALGAKLAALALDEWETGGVADENGSVSFGLLRYRVTDGGDDGDDGDDGGRSVSYARWCRWVKYTGTNDVPFRKRECHTMRAAGIVTLAALVLSCLASVWVLVAALRARRQQQSRSASAARVVRCWRASGLASTLSTLGMVAWSVGGNFVLLSLWLGDAYKPGANSAAAVPNLATSWFLVVAATLVDATVAYLARQSVLNHCAEAGLDLGLASDAPPHMQRHLQQQRAPVAIGPVVAQASAPAYQPLLAPSPYHVQQQQQAQAQAYPGLAPQVSVPLQPSAPYQPPLVRLVPQQAPPPQVGYYPVYAQPLPASQMQQQVQQQAAYAPPPAFAYHPAPPMAYPPMAYPVQSQPQAR